MHISHHRCTYYFSFRPLRKNWSLRLTATNAAQICSMYQCVGGCVLCQDPPSIICSKFSNFFAESSKRVELIVLLIVNGLPQASRPVSNRMASARSMGSPYKYINNPTTYVPADSAAAPRTLEVVPGCLFGNIYHPSHLVVTHLKSPMETRPKESIYESELHLLQTFKSTTPYPTLL